MRIESLRIAGVLVAFALLSLAVPLPHVDEFAKPRRRRSRPRATRKPKAANLNFVLKDSSARTSTSRRRREK